MSSPAFFRLRSLLARLRADSAEGTGRAGETDSAGETDIAGETDSAGETPAVAGTSGAGGAVGTRDDPIRSLEEAVQAGLDEVRQYLGVLRRQNIAMSIKVARTERRLEDLSAKLEALGCQPEAPGEE